MFCAALQVFWHFCDDLCTYLCLLCINISDSLQYFMFFSFLEHHHSCTEVYYNAQPVNFNTHSKLCTYGILILFITSFQRPKVSPVSLWYSILPLGFYRQKQWNAFGYRAPLGPTGVLTELSGPCGIISGWDGRGRTRMHRGRNNRKKGKRKVRNRKGGKSRERDGKWRARRGGKVGSCP